MKITKKIAIGACVTLFSISSLFGGYVVLEVEDEGYQSQTVTVPSGSLCGGVVETWHSGTGTYAEASISGPSFIEATGNGFDYFNDGAPGVYYLDVSATGGGFYENEWGGGEWRHAYAYADLGW